MAYLTEAALDYARDNRSAHLTELLRFLRIPSVGTLSDHRLETIAAAEWLVKNLHKIGFDNASLIRTGGNPLVCADWLHAGTDSPTVLIYEHYDVQPVDPLELWRSPPFEPTIENDYVYARGASDDKGQCFIHLKSVESYLKLLDYCRSTSSFCLKERKRVEVQPLSGLCQRIRICSWQTRH